MNWLILTSTLSICWLVLGDGVVEAQHRMVKMHPRQHHPSTVDPATVAENTLSQPVTQADPGLKLTQDSDADQSLQHDESMRLFMRAKAESVIASHSGNSLTSYEVECILTGAAPSLHPGSLSNVSWTTDIFESGTILPTTSSSNRSSFSKTFATSSWSSSSASSIFSLMSTSSDGEGNSASDAKKPKTDPDASKKAGTTDPDAKTSPTSADGRDERDLNHDGIISVDELLHSFFHADGVKSVFDKVQAETKEKLGKEGKKEIIKKAAPILHKTIEKVASNRGWGVQDARFAQLHLEDQQKKANNGGDGVDGKGGDDDDDDDGKGAEAFKDYNTFVKTMRSALITSMDAAKHSAQDQEAAPRTDPTTKA